ncbi:hypothetical protein VPH35_096894 [Triticum aestivum]
MSTSLLNWWDCHQVSVADCFYFRARSQIMLFIVNFEKPVVYCHFYIYYKLTFLVWYLSILVCPSISSFPSHCSRLEMSLFLQLICHFMFASREPPGGKSPFTPDCSLSIISF